MPARVSAFGEPGEARRLVKAPGVLQFCIAFGGERMPQSWSPVVCPGPAFPEESVAVGSGMHEAEASTASSFYLLAHDKCGNRILTGGAQCCAYDAAPCRLWPTAAFYATAAKPAARFVGGVRRRSLSGMGATARTREYTARPGVHEIHVILQTQYLRRSHAQTHAP